MIPEVEYNPPLATTEPEELLDGPARRTDQDRADRYLYLLGRPTLKQFLNFVRSYAVSPPDEGTLTDEWLAASEAIRILEKEEAGLADDSPIQKLGPEYEPLLIEFLKQPLVRGGFNRVPTQVGMVELDRLVVYQRHIDLTFVRQLNSVLGPAPSNEQIFRSCLLSYHPEPPVKWSRRIGEGFVFVSPSNDLRFLGAMPIQSSQIKDCQPPGNLVGVVGLAVGFGSNFMNAIRVENRLILNNGSHRAYGLRQMGITHAPCIVQHVPSQDEMDAVAPAAVLERLDYYLKHPRPAMLKDYFDPKLHKIMPVHRRMRQVTVKFEVEEVDVPAF